VVLGRDQPPRQRKRVDDGAGGEVSAWLIRRSHPDRRVVSLTAMPPGPEVHHDA